MPLDPEVRYNRTKDFETKVAGLEFSPEVWSTLSLLEQPSNAREIAAALLAPLATALDALERLLAAGLIQAKAIGWNEFAQRPKAPALVAVRAEGDAIVSIRIASTVPRAPAAVSFRVGAPRTSAPVAAAPVGWKLRPALDAISAAGGGGVPGQLLLLKIFLQLPPDLLKASGIESVSSVGPHTLVTDTRLRDTLVAAARAQASVDIAPFFA